jgi:hypothetical protein
VFPFLDEDAPGFARAVPAYPVVAAAAFLTFLGSSSALAGALPLPDVGPLPFRLGLAGPCPFVPGRGATLEDPEYPCDLGPAADGATLTSFLSFRSFFNGGGGGGALSVLPTFLCWILPTWPMTACARCPRAKISANEPFFGGILDASGLGAAAAAGAGRAVVGGLDADDPFGGADDGRLGGNGLAVLPADPV